MLAIFALFHTLVCNPNGGVWRGVCERQAVKSSRISSWTRTSLCDCWSYLHVIVQVNIDFELRVTVKFPQPIEHGSW